MSDHFHRPGRKNPVLRTPQFNSPPSARGRVALGVTSGAAQGVLKLQKCDSCASIQYPPRSACKSCLSSDLTWTEQDGFGELLSLTELHHSNDLYFRERLPWHFGFVKLDVGPTVMVHVPEELANAPQRVKVIVKLDRAGQAALIATSTNENSNMIHNKINREMSCDPKFRKVLVTDGKTQLGMSIVRSMIKAGAEIIWVGQSEPWKNPELIDELSKYKEVTIVNLDLTNERSVNELAGEIGGKVDIVINNAEVHRSFGIQSRRGTDVAKLEMEVNYFGLLRLAQAFGPALKSRAADGKLNACAWVNLLSIFALSNFPSHGTFSASKAAAYSLSQCLRAEMKDHGIKVVNLFPGPIDDDWNQQMPPPKVSCDALATSIVKALQSGVEDVYPGDIAQDWLKRWQKDPKILERELTLGSR